jgi:hypothetical protein
MTLRISHIANLEPAKYKAGDLVRLDGLTYTVKAASHAHLQLEGLQKAVPAWMVKPLKGRKPKGQP